MRPKCLLSKIVGLIDTLIALRYNNNTNVYCTGSMCSRKDTLVLTYGHQNTFISCRILSVQPHCSVGYEPVICEECH